MATGRPPRTSGVTARPSACGQLDRVAVRVDMAPRGERVGELERGVVERKGERVAQSAGRGRVAEFDD